MLEELLRLVALYRVLVLLCRLRVSPVVLQVVNLIHLQVEVEARLGALVEVEAVIVLVIVLVIGLVIGPAMLPMLAHFADDLGALKLEVVIPFHQTWEF